jgi:collagen type VII alpha
MKRITYPIRAIREPFGTAGLVVAIVALVAALGGGAYAASGGLNAKQKTEVTKIAKRFAGRTGAQGPRGNAGPAGAKGNTGSPGAPGQTGFTATLPSGSTETGAWSIFASKIENFKFPKTVGSISFPIPLAAKGGPQSAFAFTKADTATGTFGSSGCSGSVENPTAPRGVLCIYTSEEERVGVAGAVVPTDPNEPTGGFARFGRSGALLNGIAFAAAVPDAHAGFSGTWAVTAP